MFKESVLKILSRVILTVTRQNTSYLKGLPPPWTKFSFLIFDLTHNFIEFLSIVYFLWVTFVRLQRTWNRNIILTSVLCLSASHPAPRNLSNHRPENRARRSVWAYLMCRWAGSLWFIALSLSGRTQIGVDNRHQPLCILSELYFLWFGRDPFKLQCF